LRIDTPAGLVVAQAQVVNGRVDRVSFRNVPSFVAELNAIAAVPGLGDVHYDLAFGGAFYAYVQARAVGLECTPADYRALIDVGMAIK
ncbi:proline racemase family protein, partial [Klebsiella pneumoniae]|uniref:proline racemase family protein n=1 Tax=Klebsiella pneumoniae TaxID=573 RepID=UPI00226E45B7